MVKSLPAVWKTQVQSLDWEDPLEKEMATHSSILAWEIPWTEEPGRLQSMGSRRVGHDWVTSLFQDDKFVQYILCVNPWNLHQKDKSPKYVTIGLFPEDPKVSVEGKTWDKMLEVWNSRRQKSSWRRISINRIHLSSNLVSGEQKIITRNFSLDQFTGRNHVLKDGITRGKCP